MARAMRARSLFTAVGALAAGAIATFFLDPEQGKRRRALARDKVSSGLRQAAESSQALAEDLRNRSGGLAARLRGRLEPRPVADDKLAERVRSRAGRFVSHPGSIDIQVLQGEVTVSGPVLEAEAASLLSAVRRTPGVQSVVDRLERHADAGNVPGLQS
jgi:gas vesicle protein